MKVSAMPRPIAYWVYLLYGALILVGLVSVVRYLPLFFPPAQYDFRAYYAAGYAVIHQLSIYEKHLDYQPVFLYMPITALFFVPLAWFPMATALWIWYAINLIVWGSWVWLLITHVPLTRRQQLLVIMTAVVLPASIDIISLGQITHLIMLGIVAALVLLRRGASGWAGVIVGLVIIIKVQLLLLALLFLWRKDVRGVLATAATVGMGIILGALALGWVTVWEWVNAIQQKAVVSAIFPVNQSLNASITRFFVPQQVQTAVFRIDNAQQIPVYALLTPAWLAQWLVMSIIICIGWYTYQRARTITDSDMQAAIVLPIMLLVTPLSWDSYMVYLLWPIALLWAKVRHTHDVIWLTLIVGCMLVHRFWRVLVWQSHSPLVLIWGCVAMLCCWWAIIRIGNRSAREEAQNGTH
jgi:hypothetical protein